MLIRAAVGAVVTYSFMFCTWGALAGFIQKRWKPATMMLVIATISFLIIIFA